MSLVTMRLFFDDQPASAEQLDLFREIRVDQAIGVATEAELDVDLTLDDQGAWSVIEDEFVQPFRRVRVEVQVGEGAFMPLIDGPIVAQRFQLGAGPAESTMTLVVHDDSVLLNQAEEVDLFENMAAHEIAETLISRGGLTPEVESVPAAGASLDRYVVQRGTAMHLLRDLARRHGMFVYVRPGEAPGQSVCVFAKPSLEPGDVPQLLLLGADRNIRKFSAELDALQPFTARAGSVRVSDKTILTSSTDAPEVDALGDEPVHTLVGSPGIALLSRTREEQNDLDAATASAVDQSSFAYTATAEIDANDYDTVLSPHQTITVAGPGGYLGGTYLISQVQHRLTDGAYQQNVTLKRNARSGGSQAGGGGLLSGVF